MLIQTTDEELSGQSCSQQQAAALCGAWGVVTWSELTDGNRATTLKLPSKVSDQPEVHTYSAAYCNWMLQNGHIYGIALRFRLNEIELELNPKPV